MRPGRLSIVALVLAPLMLVAGCSATRSVGYSFWETFGYEKRDLLVDQVEDTRGEQEEAREEFANALEQFKATFGFDGGDLEAAYRGLKDSYDDCEAQADDLRGEIAKVKTIAGDLFEEWEEEIEQQSEPSYQELMREQIAATRVSYRQMVGKMDAAAAKMDPVLLGFKNRVLLLKSSLNAKAIAQLEATSEELIGNIETLIAEMEASIAEADAFIAAMQG